MLDKKVCIHTIGILATFLREYIDYPPKGYQFIVSKKFYEPILRNKILYYKVLQGKVANVVPVRLIKSLYDKFFCGLKKEKIDLIFTWSLLIFFEKPWVIYLEEVTHPLGSEFLRTFYMQKLRFKRIIEKAFASEYCKKIICPSHFVESQILSNLNVQQFENKIEVVYAATHKKNFVKSYDKDVIKLLFIGSINYPREFLIRNGIEVVEAFKMLSQKYDNLELIIRADVPGKIKRRYNTLPNIHWIEEILPVDKLEKLFKEADIFACPLQLTFAHSLIEAMSYELPIITLDIYANPEIVRDGETGFLIKPPSEICYFYPGTNIVYYDKGKITNPNRRPFMKVVEEIVEKTSILIENPELRRKMGKAARWEAEHGKFSIEERNKKLKRIFGEATA